MISETLIASVIERFEHFVTQKKLRRTPQRADIIQAVFSQDEHFIADELYERIKKNNAVISRATVYRTLNLLVQAQLLREINIGSDQKTYDPNFLNKPAHNHLLCVDCDKVVEFEDSHVELLHDCITRRLGFRAVSQQLTIEAACEQLRVNGRCPNLIASRLSAKRLRKKR